jgi:thioesterase domain-containing protein
MVSRHRVTVWNSVPALMEMLVDHLEGRGEPLPACLRLVLLSGDWIPVGLPARIRALSPASSIEVVGLGGATEASIWSIAYPVAAVDPAWTSIPYGRPLANQTWQVLDEALAPRPLWVPGDLYVGGTGLARGYWRDEVKTAASFPVHPRTGERLYRTGDLGRWLPDGTLEFLGREDLQVKVQGYRIELGEIEAALAAHPGVRAGVVAAVGERRGSKRLVAFVVPAAEPGPDDGELREFLATKLPQYMVPASFVALDALPLTANGKVDRAALERRAAAGGAETKESFVAPRDEREARLAQLWEEVLGSSPVSVRDNFFALGGHSLSAVRLLARVRGEFGRDLPLSVLFEAPTVERLAARLGGADEGARPALVPIRTGGTRAPFFCVHPVGGDVLCYAELARRLGDGQPFYGLQSPEPEGAAPRLEELAASYLAAVRAVQPRGPYRLGGWSMGGVVAFEMARQLGVEGERVELVALIDAAVPGGAAGEVDDSTLAAWFARDLGGLVGADLGLAAADFAGLDADGQAGTLLERARAAAALPPELGLPEMRRHLEMFRRNYRALLDYVPGEYPGSLLLLPAADGACGEEAAAVWRALAAGAVEVQTVPGDHYSMVRSPHVEVLARRLGVWLEGRGNGERERA